MRTMAASGLAWHVPHLGGWIALLMLAAVAVFGTAAAVRLGWARLVHGSRRPRLGLVTRVRWRMHPGPGWARRWSVWRSHGRPAARRVARYARPSLSWAARRFGPWREYATFLGWASQGWLFRWRVYAHLESLVLVIAAPQEGKSQAAAGAIIDAPGPVLATSIRGDLVGATAGLRARVGRVHIWNPEETGGFGSTFGWNPVAGCEDVGTAVRRAGYMVEAVTGRGLSDEAFWNDQASMVLAACLHAAALAGGDMRHVDGWVTSEDQAPARILAAHPGADPRALAQVRLYLGLTQRTRQGIGTTLNRVLRFMQLPGCVDAVTPGPGEGLDFAAFVTSRDTLYLVASDGATSPVPPLFLAITAELAHAAREAGGVPRPARPPRGRLLGSAWLGRAFDALFPPRTVRRLDPPLSMILDEVANTAPVPAASWSSWAAGSGVRLYLVVQAYAQLVQRWGRDGAAIIWQCCKTRVVYGATAEDELCALVERACGTVRVRTVEHAGDRRRHRHEDVPLMPAAALRELPAGRAVVIQGRGRPVIVRVEQVSRRADAKLYARHGTPAALPVPSPRQVPVPEPELLAPAPRLDRWPGPGAGVAPPPDELAARRDRNARPGQDGDGRPAPRRPSRPAPWERPAAGGEDK